MQFEELNHIAASRHALPAGDSGISPGRRCSPQPSGFTTATNVIELQKTKRKAFKNLHMYDACQVVLFQKDVALGLLSVFPFAEI